MTVFRGYIGTYTKGDSKGIYTFTLDTEKKELSTPTLAAELENPTYITVTADSQTLYAVGKEGEFGGLSSYKISEENGKLTLLNSEVSSGSSPCHVSVNHTNEKVLTGYYHRGTAELYNTAGGKVAPVSAFVQHTGSGPNVERQEKSHVHFSGFTPDEKYAVVVDLGIDKIVTYSIENNSLEIKNSLSVKPGSGPRHIAFHPNGKFAYVMTELSNEVIVMSYNSEDAKFTEVQYISAIPADFTENSQGSAIHLSSDGRFVYVGNRGHNSIALFSVNNETGELAFIEHTFTEGNWPRDFVLDPTEKFLVASNEQSGNLVLYSRNVKTGKITLEQSNVAVPYPVCVKFLPN